MKQISNTVLCDDLILDLDLSTRFMPNQYYDYPYLMIENFWRELSCNIIAEHAFNNSDAQRAKVQDDDLDQHRRPQR